MVEAATHRAAYIRADDEFTVWAVPRPHSMVNVGSDLCSQDGTSSRIHVVDLMTCWTGYRLIGVVVLRRVFSGKTLNAVSGYGAAVDEKRHGRKARA